MHHHWKPLQTTVLMIWLLACCDNTKCESKFWYVRHIFFLRYSRILAEDEFCCRIIFRGRKGKGSSTFVVILYSLYEGYGRALG